MKMTNEILSDFCWNKCKYRWGDEDEGGCDCSETTISPCMVREEYYNREELWDYLLKEFSK